MLDLLFLIHDLIESAVIKNKYTFRLSASSIDTLINYSDFQSIEIVVRIFQQVVRQASNFKNIEYELNYRESLGK
jgi:hypothetical protein